MGKPTRRQRVEQWLLDYGHLINKQAWDREVKAKTIGRTQKFYRYGKRLNDNHIRLSFELIKKIGKI